MLYKICIFGQTSLFRIYFVSNEFAKFIEINKHERKFILQRKKLKALFVFDQNVWLLQDFCSLCVFISKLWQNVGNKIIYLYFYCSFKPLVTLWSSNFQPEVHEPS